MLIKEAKEITGDLSAPGKMPEGSYNLPAAACQTGAKLRKVKGTPCHGCYAFKFRYNFSNVKKALARRLASLDHPQWAEAMTVLVKKILHLHQVQGLSPQIIGQRFGFSTARIYNIIRRQAPQSPKLQASSSKPQNGHN